MKRLGVLGWPVRHSRSPDMQNAALAASGMAEGWHYQLLPVPPELFAETVVELPALGFVGANVTVPHKARALALARASGGEVSPRAAAIGAANTLLFRPGGRVDADNTDAPGLLAELRRHVELDGASAMVLGAGGSARAAVWALRDAGAASVMVWNRTHTRAVDMCEALGAEPVRRVSGADILVNCTTVGLRADDSVAMLPLPAAGLDAFHVVADLVYHERGAALTRAARAAGLVVVDGLEILVAQGAAAFEAFTGEPAPIEAMRAAVGIAQAR